MNRSHYKTTHSEFWRDLALAVFIGVIAAMLLADWALQ